MLEDVEGVAVGDDFALAGADGVDLLAVFVIDVVPRAGGLDIADFLGLHGSKCHEHDEGDEDSFHILMII